MIACTSDSCVPTLSAADTCLIKGSILTEALQSEATRCHGKHRYYETHLSLIMQEAVIQHVLPLCERVQNNFCCKQGPCNGVT